MRRIVRSLAADGRGEGGSGGSLGVREYDRETIHITLQRDWSSLQKTAELRRAAARRLLDHLLSNVPSGTRGTDLLVETTLGKLLTAVKSDMALTSQIKDPGKLTDRALLWLHEQEVVRLNKGLTVFRQAMIVQLKPERRGFAQADFKPLELHYNETGIANSRDRGVRTAGTGSDNRRPAHGHGLLQSAPRGISAALAA